MGNHRQALQLIVTQLQDVEYAIDFCKEHNYESLWNELIDYSLSKPSKQPTGFLLINFRVLFRLQLNYECYSFWGIKFLTNNLKVNNDSSACKICINGFIYLQIASIASYRKYREGCALNNISRSRMSCNESQFLLIFSL